MATATILHIGDGVCYSIPLERVGLHAVRTECSVRALENAFAEGETYSGIAFHNEVASPLRAVAESARILSTAPRILFLNSLIDYDEELFDLVVPVQTPPAIWLQCLEGTIRRTRGLLEESERLRQECADIRKFSRELQRISRRNREIPIDYDALWCAKPE